MLKPYIQKRRAWFVNQTNILVSNCRALRISSSQVYYKARFNLPSILVGSWSLFFIFLATISSIFFGNFAPEIFRILTLPEDLSLLTTNLLSTYIGVLGFAIAVSAIILSILQLANRKIQITELVFNRTWFAPTFYFGIINVTVLVIIHLLGFYHPELEDSRLLFEKILITETYLFLVFAALNLVVLFKVFSLAKSSNLTTLYIKDIIRFAKYQSKLNQKNTNVKKIALKRSELFQEIEIGIDNNEGPTISTFLECFKKIIQTDPRSQLLWGIENKIESWLAKTSQNTDTRWYFLDFWNFLTLFYSQLNSPKEISLKFTAANVYNQLRSKGEEKDLAEFFSMRFKEIISYQIIFPKQGNIEALNKAKPEIHKILLAFNELMKAFAINNDVASLRFALNELGQLNSGTSMFETNIFELDQEETNTSESDTHKLEIATFRSEFQSDIFLIPLGIYFFLLFGLSYEKNTKPPKEIIDEFRRILFFYHSAPINIILRDYNKYVDRYQWSHWIFQLENPLSGQAVTLSSKEDMLVSGFIIDLFLSKTQTNFIPDFALKHENILLFVHHCLRELQAMDNTYWSSKLEIRKIVFEDQKVKMIKYLEKIRNDLEMENLRIVAESPSDPSKKQQFKKAISDEWVQSQNIDRIFENLDAMGVGDESTKLIISRHHIGGLKNVLASSSQAPLSAFGLGKNHALKKENLLGLQIDQANIPVNPANNLIDGIESGITELKRRGFETSLIMVFSKKLYPENPELINSGKFVPKGKLLDGTYPFDVLGVFGGLTPIVKFHSFYTTNKVVIASLPNAIRLNQTTSFDWGNNKLRIEVSDVQENEVENIYNRTAKQDNNSLTPEAKLDILTGVHVEIQERFDFDILDPAALYIFSF